MWGKKFCMNKDDDGEEEEFAWKELEDKKKQGEKFEKKRLKVV